eukprot:1538387-Rhodomonas_salina.1
MLCITMCADGARATHAVQNRTGMSCRGGDALWECCAAAAAAALCVCCLRLCVLEHPAWGELTAHRGRGQ